mmetsp:Transcript_29539/g.33862  ORF Transcript_29539/g.33862 Transcript_29539/m.33862 type:complete len:94 (-) Transcript_29539:47-328(-)
MSSKSTDGKQPVGKSKSNKPFAGQGVTVGGGDFDSMDQRALRAEAAQKRLQENSQKGFNKASYAEMERKKKLTEQMEKDRADQGERYNMKWNK